MSRHVLITGGAGFIGSHLADELLAHGYRVRVLDQLSPQVHGAAGKRPEYLDDEVELMHGDVRDLEAVKKAMRGIDAVFHLAAMVGVGQSMYQIADYTAANQLGTAVLLEAAVNAKISKLVVASSMSIYGEGLYVDRAGKIQPSVARSIDQLKAGQWEMSGPDGQPLEPVPTPESKQPALASVYALSKYDQERMCLIVGQAYSMPTTALRFFNVYGPRQALSNPYTGVLAIFASRLLNNKPPLIFEDGYQKRDFISVHDIARACRLALESDKSAGEVFNIGSGNAYTVRQLGERLASVMGKRSITPIVNGAYRVGDIRHCFADISHARKLLGFEPRVTLEEGMTELAGWLEGQMASDHVEQAHAELAARGLTL
jgi:dTDP-L-rhamnose 4-epimerase